MKPRRVSRLTRICRMSSGTQSGPAGPADIFKVNVNAVWAGSLDASGQVGLAVVDATVETEFLFDEAAFLLTSSDADDATPFDLGDLSDHRADCPGSRCHNERFSGLRFADVEQAGISSE